MTLDPNEIISFFEEREDIFETRYGAVVQMKDGTIYTSLRLPDTMEMNMNLRLVMDEDSVQSFISGFKLHSLHDIDRISYNHLWMRYVNGEGVFFAKEKVATDAKMMQSAQLEVGFRLIGSKTIVFCKELNFYDEVNERLTMPDELEEFVERVRDKMQAAGHKLETYASA